MTYASLAAQANNCRTSHAQPENAMQLQAKYIYPLTDESLFCDCGKLPALCGECKQVRLYHGERHCKQLPRNAPCQLATIRATRTSALSKRLRKWMFKCSKTSKTSQTSTHKHVHRHICTSIPNNWPATNRTHHKQVFLTAQTYTNRYTHTHSHSHTQTHESAQPSH